MASGRRIPRQVILPTDNLSPNAKYEGSVGTSTKPWQYIRGGTITGSLVLSRQKLVASGAFEGKDGARITGSFNHSGSSAVKMRTGLVITGSLGYSGSSAASLKTGLRVTGSFDHSGSTPPNLRVGLRITGSLNHSGSGFFKGKVITTGSFNISGSTPTVKVVGNTTITGSLYISGSFGVSQVLRVRGNTAITGSEKITGNITPDQNPGGSLGSITLPWLRVWAETITGSRIQANTELVSTGSLKVLSGASRVTGSLNITGSAGITETLFVKGKPKISGTLFVSRDASYGNQLGVGVTGSLKVTRELVTGTYLTLANMPSAPGTPVNGMLIVSGSGAAMHLYCRLNGGWVQVD